MDEHRACNGNFTLLSQEPGHYLEPPSSVLTLATLSHIFLLLETVLMGVFTTPFRYPMTPELRPFFVTTKTEIPLLPSDLHFLSANKVFRGNQETFALSTSLKIE